MASIKPALFSILALCAVVVFVAGGIWFYKQHVLATDLASADEWSAIEKTEALLQDGPNLSDWPVRGFVPASVLQSAASTLRDVKIIVPVGPNVDGHVDGYVHLTVGPVSLIPGSEQIGVRLSASADYSADRKEPWWSGAKAEIDIDTLLFPSSQTDKNGVLVTTLRVVPNSISLATSWNNFGIRARGLAAALIADQALLKLRDGLELSIPTISPSVEVDPSVHSSSFQAFGGNGGTNIVLGMSHPPQTLKISLDRWLTTPSGIWLLGGRPPVSKPADLPFPSASELQSRRTALSEKLKSFQRSGSSIELTLPGDALTEFVDRLLQPSPLAIAVTTSGTSGIITEAMVLHDDKVLGDLGLQVRPKGDNFASGTISISPGKATWSGQSGLNVPLAVTADAMMSLDLHIATGIGGGIGNTVGLKAGADIKTALLNASFQQKTLPDGSALVLQPAIPCVPAIIRAYPGAAPAIAENWIVVSPVGLELDREFGGMKIAPAVLIDGMPTILALVNGIGPDGNPMKPDPQKVVVQFPKPFLEMTLSPSGIVMDEAGVTVRATAAMSTRDQRETDVESAKRSAFRQALKDATPEANCKAFSGVKIVGGDAALVDLYKEYLYIGRSLKNHEKVAEQVFKSLTDLDPRNTPANLTKLANAVGTAVNADVKRAWDTIQHPPAVSASAGGVIVKAGPVGPTVSGQVGGTKVEVAPTHVGVGGVCLGIGC